jgi:rhodanese-related sulfurtransferase
MRFRWYPHVCLLSTLPLAMLACSDSDGDGGGWSQAAIAARVDGVLKVGLNTIDADAVAQLFFDADPANDPFLLDVRQPADFASGHVPGAVNVPLRQFARRYAEEGSALIPADRNVVVVSYVGGDGNMASFLINAVRITDPANAGTFPWSKSIMMGMQAWTFDKSLAADLRWPDDLGTARIEAPTEATPNPGGAFGPLQLGNVQAGSLEAAILARAAAYFDRFTSDFQMQLVAPDLEALLSDPNPGNDPQILSVRGGPDYAKGHIRGAVNLGWKDVADLTKIGVVDPSKPIVAYCYTGHTGSLSTIALGILGYDVRNLLYGMDGWNPSPAIGAGKLLNFDTIRGWDLPVDDGSASDLGDLTAYTPPTGCVACHSSLTAVLYDRTVDRPAEPDAPPSVGEG